MIMPQNLFAACREDNDRLITKRVRLDANVQRAIERTFADQEAQFRAGITDEIEFDGSWKPEDNELLTLDLPEEAKIFVDTIDANALAVPDIDAANFDREGIRALFTGTANRGVVKVLVQQFSTRQMLSQKFALLQDGNAFRRLTDQAFTIDTSLTCVVEFGTLKFKSFHKLRSIVNLIDVYKAATNQELETFARDGEFEVKDYAGFLELADQTTRKLIHAIMRSGILNEHEAVDIQARANAVGLPVVLNNNKIVMPSTRAEVKKLLRFLDDGLYEAPLSGQRYITNSKKRA